MLLHQEFKSKNRIMKNFTVTILLLLALTVNAQFGNQGATGFKWNASWITVPEAGTTTSGLYLFRKKLTLETVPSSFIVYVSADSRYKLFVNETFVSLGPAVGDIQHWNYETVDLAPFLRAGQNIISAKVWNEGNMKPVHQISFRTGFILQGSTTETQVVNTNDTWKCIQDKSYTPIQQRVRGYYAAGAGDQIDMQFHPAGWEKLSFDDSKWLRAESVFGTASGRQGMARRGGWNLVPSILPPMEMTLQRLVTTRKSEGVKVPPAFPANKTAVRIPANTTARILIDQTFLTNAYPTLEFSGGKNDTITITYAEALYGDKGIKGNRDEIEGKTISGRRDIIISDGSDNQSFTTLAYRTYRYVELKIVTLGNPLVIEDFYGTFTGYPFKFNAKLESGNSTIDKIIEIGWRTARLCAVDTYMDCPYYERLQYIGDARIQLLVSYYNSGDDRLAKNALNLMGWSRQLDGYTFSRYPDNLGQIIPTYSLWYVSMLHDYMMYGSDPDFITDKLAGQRQILNYFISYLDEDGSLKNVPNWNFTDWASGWQRGTAPIGEDGSSAAMDLQMLLAIQSAVDLENYAGRKEFADFYGALAAKITQTVKRKYWDSTRKLFADTPGKDKFSQHTNSMAILAGLVQGVEAQNIGKLMLSDASLTQASIYFKYYLHLALTKAGLGNDFMNWLDIWHKNIDLGLSTWGETSEVESTRSDCHAWGASPNIEFFRIVLGIESSTPNFKSVKIEPNLGSIKTISGEMPHPAGKISVKYDNSGSRFSADIMLPPKTTGVFIWQGKSYELNEGLNPIRL